MTIKLVALWSTPEDPDGFEADFAATHVGLVAALPGLSGSIFSKAIDGPYFRMSELLFDDGDALGGAVGSDEGMALLADSGRLQETYGSKLDVLIVEEQSRS